MSELFIELLSEEIPYWLQKNIVEQFKEKITDVIIENNLSLKNKVSIDSNFTQLRLIFSCSNLIKEQKSSIKEVKGPPVNAPENAIMGFLKKVGVPKEKLEKKIIKYKDIYLESEKQFSKYNFELANTEYLFKCFEYVENECKELLSNDLPLPAYENCIKASHYFNILDARGVIGVAQRQSYILKIRSLVKSCCEIYIKQEF